MAEVSIWPGSEQRQARRGTKASSAAVSFTRRVKESETANVGHGNGPHLDWLLGRYRPRPGPSRSLEMIRGGSCDGSRRGCCTVCVLTSRFRFLVEPALGCDGEGAAEEAIDVLGQGLVLGTVRTREAFGNAPPGFRGDGSVPVDAVA